MVYESKRPRSAAVMFTEPAADSAVEIASPERFMGIPLVWRFDKSVVEMERFCVLTLNRKRPLFVIPVRVTMRIQIRLARVSAKGMPTHTKRPSLPMMMMMMMIMRVLMLSR